MDEETSSSDDGVKPWTAREMAVDFIKTVASGVVDYAKKGEILARPEIRINRLEKCWEPCGSYNKDNGKCKVCGCSVKARTALLRKVCPLGKW